jgi:microcompartment protein CcmK/EutM
MRIAQVIGKVTLSVQDPSFTGGRWLVCSPVTENRINQACTADAMVSPEPSLVAWDDIGAGLGDVIGIVEGAEATAPFDRDIAIDAINVAIFDSLSHQPLPSNTDARP